MFNSPNHMAINTLSTDIYICDGGNNRVQVFNKSFEFSFQFSEGMNNPVGISLRMNKVYVTHWGSHCLNIYSTEGKFLKSVGREGKKPLEFNRPNGLDVSSYKARIYVVDCYNDRIQCLNFDLQFVSFIFDIQRPVDVKLTPNEIVLLSFSSLCVFLYSYSHQLIGKMFLAKKVILLVMLLLSFLISL